MARNLRFGATNYYLHPKAVTYQAEEEIVDQFWYHPFYPIYLKDIENQETEMKLDAIVPAFTLFANQKKQFWSNVITAVEYALDVVTTLSGVGNLAKYRYLARITQLAEVVEGASAVSKVAKAANILRYVKGAAGVVELTSGSVNLMLKITEARDTEFGGSLSKVLFFLELITLSGELTASMKLGLRKSAKEAVEASDGALRIKHPELFNELNNIAYGTKLTSISELQKFLKENNIIGDIDLAFVEKISFGRADLAESLLLSLRQVQKGKTVEELVILFKIIDPPKLASLTNYEARIWYTWKKTKIEKLISKEKTLEAKAKKAFELRNEYRTATRKYMKDQKWSEHLERVETNQEWQNLLERTLKKNKINSLEEAYQYIIESSKKGRDGVDILFNIK